MNQFVIEAKIHRIKKENYTFFTVVPQDRLRRKSNAIVDNCHFDFVAEFLKSLDWDENNLSKQTYWLALERPFHSESPCRILSIEAVAELKSVH